MKAVEELWICGCHPTKELPHDTRRQSGTRSTSTLGGASGQRRLVKSALATRASQALSEGSARLFGPNSLNRDRPDCNGFPCW